MNDSLFLIYVSRKYNDNNNNNNNNGCDNNGDVSDDDDEDITFVVLQCQCFP